eukprot:145461-Ditylum_brightwellii.AAC.1
MKLSNLVCIIDKSIKMCNSGRHDIFNSFITNFLEGKEGYCFILVLVSIVMMFLQKLYNMHYALVEL